MFSKRFFGNMSRSGFGPGISIAKLSKVMLEISAFFQPIIFRLFYSILNILK